MDASLQKALGELLLNAVPTMVIFLVLFAAYRTLVHQPLMKVLAQRHELTAGAVAKAKADIAGAEAQTAQYEHKLREARLIVFKAEEARRKLVLEARAAAISEARSRADAQVREARQVIEKETAAARTGLQQQSESLAAEIITAVLRSASPGRRRPMAGTQP